MGIKKFLMKQENLHEEIKSNLDFDMKISILLPYKENFSPIYAGAVSLFVKDTTNISKYKNHITIYGNTNLKRIYNLN